jgi:hypothetical protein
MSDKETIKNMMAIYAGYKRKWEEGKLYDELKTVLEKTKDRMAIKTVVCLSIGSFHKPEDEEEEERSYTHLAALMTVVDHLSKFLYHSFYLFLC